MTPKQRMVLAGLRDAQHAHDGQAATVWQIAQLTAGRWQGRADLVAAALKLLERDGLVRMGPDGRYTLTPDGRKVLVPRRGPARQRPAPGQRPQ